MSESGSRCKPELGENSVAMDMAKIGKGCSFIVQSPGYGDGWYPGGNYSCTWLFTVSCKIKGTGKGADLITKVTKW